MKTRTTSTGSAGSMLGHKRTRRQVAHATASVCLLDQTQIRKKGPVHMYGGLVTDET
jgi:hypothetical protein